MATVWGHSTREGCRYAVCSSSGGSMQCRAHAARHAITTDGAYF